MAEIDHFGVLGSVDNVYYTWSEKLSAGVTKANNELYLIVPNGWEGRLWHYDWWLGRIYWSNLIRDKPYNGETASSTSIGWSTSEQARDMYHEHNTKDRSNKKGRIRTKLVIPMGSVSNDETKYEVQYPSDYPDFDNVTIMVARIAVKNNNSKVLFSFKFSTNRILIDYGDGTYDYGNVDDTTGMYSHEYSSAGTYEVRVVNQNVNRWHGVMSVESSDTASCFIYEESEVSQSGSCDTIQSLFFNPYYKGITTDTITIANQNSLSSLIFEWVRNSSISLIIKNCNNLEELVLCSTERVRTSPVYLRDNDKLSSVIMNEMISRLSIYDMQNTQYTIYMYSKNIDGFTNYVDSCNMLFGISVDQSLLDGLKSKYPSLSIIGR